MAAPASTFSEKLAAQKIEALAELGGATESASGRSTERSYGRRDARDINNAIKEKEPDNKPQYVFNFNDIPQITSDLHGIKSLEAALLDSQAEGTREESSTHLGGAGGVPATYHVDTTSQPKGPGEEFSNLDQDKVRSAFSKTDFLGIRSLPNALEPNFRQQLYMDVLSVVKLDRDRQRIITEMRGSAALMSAAVNGMQYSVDVGPGQRRAGRFSALPDEMTSSFSTFTHMHTPYDAESDATRAATMMEKTLRQDKDEFTVKTIERPLTGQGCFSTPSYSSQPYEDKEDMMRALRHMTRAEQLQFSAAPWISPGKPKEMFELKGRMADSLDSLCSFCAENWPRSFRQLFEDKSGCFVIEFDRLQAEQEGDLTTFMNHMARTHLTVLDFHLSKDATRWGIMEEGEGTAVYYVFWPPWSHHRVEAPDHLKGPVPRATKLLWETRPALPVDRVPFLLGNNNGLFDHAYVKRTDERSFR